ncbi:OprD family porin [Stutzerimonas nitrititolerans]|uniref:OprD family porin n=1 Tax=Stutzerimonas nitrititolerans TaxID=2482751 RepID=UPI0028AB8E2F|nr:OprD family porin [Stutzerimonas nitrititolerans]
MKIMPKLAIGIATTVALMSAGTAYSDTQQESKGFIEDSKLSLLNRNFYFNRDFRDADPDDQSYREEWAHGIMAFYESGFTQGSVGFGLDAYGFLGLKLDSGRGRSGTGLLPIDEDDRARDDYGHVGGALKLRVASTVLKYGEMQTSAPVFATADSRLLPETATGFLITSGDIPGAVIEAGHFTAYNYRNSTNGDDDLLVETGEADQQGDSISFVGGQYDFTDALTGSLYASNFEDTWRQYYANLNYTMVLGEDQALNLDANFYRTRDAGDAYFGEIDNRTYSLAAEYSLGAHSFTFAYQKAKGDTPFDYVGGDSIFLANAVSISDFVGANETSYQLRYDINLAAYGVPGLKMSARYIRGNNIDGTDADASGAYAGLQGADGKHWERGFDVRYTVQSGPAKDLSLRLRQATHRGNDDQAEGDVDEVRFIVEYPLDLI